MIIANSQTDAIGTHGKKWYTENENNIAFSLFIKTNTKLENLENLTIQIAQIWLKIFKILYNIKLDIKLPNDITYNGKKIGGILTQTKVKNETVKCIIIGIGINTNQANMCKQLQNIATSIKKEFNINVDNEKLIEKFCELFEEELYRRKIQ